MRKEFKNKNQGKGNAHRLRSAAVAGIATLGLVGGTLLSPLPSYNTAETRSFENYSLHNQRIYHFI